MSIATSSRLRSRLVGLTLAVSVVGAIAQGTLEAEPAEHALAPAAAVEEIVSLASAATTPPVTAAQDTAP